MNALRLTFSALALAAFFLAPTGLFAQPTRLDAALEDNSSDDDRKIIYGDDNRVDYFRAPAARRAIADSVVSIWFSEDVQPSSNGFRLRTISFTDAIKKQYSKPLCMREPFRTQPKGAVCSGSLVGEDLVMTAGHCIDDQENCESLKFVFGFAVARRGGAAPTEVPAANVYSCKKLEARELDGKSDYALVRLDRKVTGRRPLQVNDKGDLATGAQIFVVGHPKGLPVKIADDATVRDIMTGHDYFTTNLDTYSGNSGSAVFNAATNKIEGILVRGDKDFRGGSESFLWVFKNNCVESNRVPQSGAGESVNKLNDVILGVIKGGQNKSLSAEELSVAENASLAAPLSDSVSLDFDGI